MSVPRLITIMREQGSASILKNDFFGEVLSTSPLTIHTTGITLGSNQLKILNDATLTTGDTVLLFRTGAFFIVLGKVSNP
ncbi:DUF2577 domain-containing protein [Robertmurraya korlensis]|uniref:DUF2577 family protein n=1 Tax=Robertmurraya korlensis TaxID=519977 RepID=UPI00203E4D0C|nr:DUF2577 family protein [Robertmurraya korlensis]MCM3599398.1 DUF2577 domain-containing protein [Robertmurraya korlensis]